MSEFEYSLDEHRLIMQALGLRREPASNSTKIWDAHCVKPVKRRLKDHRLREQRGVCCYCQQYIQGQHSMTLDLEHILPKSIFTHCIFDLKNLAVSCRRCNFYKGDKVDFLLDDLLMVPKIDKSKLFNMMHYKFAHPNLTDVFSHLVVQKAQDGPAVILRYRIVSEIGKFTYDYFRLQALEVSAMDEVQGISPPESGFLYALVQQIEKEVYE
ncbi:HNH endonuclease [Pseudomonas moraviensis]|uniref:HNH endonuclease n=1 Tax=Pseudomonas TaxID=286 RepID=UPI000BA4E253|nr:HNH endonuclease domain-containing protein [Pseudomonas sp. Irchel 3F6]